MNPIDFIKNVKSFTKNPLGIIGLFVSLIYGFACLVLGVSISNLKGYPERLPLIWFIIIFPVVILAAFVYLVINHHEKLYSPSDFREDSAFIRTIPKSKQEQKLNDEITELNIAPDKTLLNYENNETPTVNDTIEIPIDENNHGNHINISTTTNTSTNDLISSKLRNTKEELISIIENTKKWTLKEIGLKYKITFIPNIVYTTLYGNIEPDAIAKDNEKLYLAEIKYWDTNKSDNGLKYSILNFLQQGKNIDPMTKYMVDLKLIVVLVFDDLSNVNKDEYIRFAKSINNSAEVLFYTYSYLRDSYE